ncbi:hypothetical protein BCF59_0087 [Mycoplasmopsis mustelae]|uniref:Uncharacterized protein n=1 Tax=Mycoplasmopsis mustelae TaxID=171289 RepID=A0A4V3FNX0_9BACT|nr:hypothetical protein [Mycoplasmopsis mustelae]TDV24140.1 hypothetical protein BCF59_0087 [Mycoplasmopsis mustelae]
MKKTLKKFLHTYQEFNKKDWATFLIGFFLIMVYLCIIMWDWSDKSFSTWQVFNKIYKDDPDFFEKINQMANSVSSHDEKSAIYRATLPNAVLILWGGTSYWFTFICNVLMAISILLFPFFKESKKAQKFYFAGIVYIIIVVLVFWFGWLTDKTIGGNFSRNDFYRTLVWHAIAPFFGIITLIWERKRIRISTQVIWSYSIFPICYLIFLLLIYIFGYKFKNFTSADFLPNSENQNHPNVIPNEFNTELDRGIAIYSIISFWNPLGYTGDNFYLKSVLIIIIVLSSFLTAPTIGFILRKVLRILQPGQKKLPPLRFSAQKKTKKS